MAKTANRTDLARWLADQTGVPVEAVEAELLRITKERSAANVPKPDPEPVDDLGEQTRAALEQMDPKVRAEAERLLAEVDDPVDPLPVPFKAKDTRQRLKTGRSTIAGFLSDLEDKGFLDLVADTAGGRGRPPKYWKPTGRGGEDVDVLPPVEELFPKGAGDETAKIPPVKPR